MSTLATALLSIFGVAVGAILQSVLARRNRLEHQVVEWRNQAYTDFLKAISLVVASQRRGDLDTTTVHLAELADAKSRICIYGEIDVIEELAEFWRQGASLETEPEILSFSRLCIKIRDSIGLTGGRSEERRVWK